MSQTTLLTDKPNTGTQPSIPIKEIPSSVTLEQRVEQSASGKIEVKGLGSEPTIVPERYKVDLPVGSQVVDDMLRTRTSAPTIRPELVEQDKIRAPEAYKRFRDAEQKAAYRNDLVDQLHAEWKKLYGIDKADLYRAEFESLASTIETNGAAIFGKMISTANFSVLIEQYTEILKTMGSKSWIHSYINLGNHPNFLSDQRFNGAFLHPLIIALISHRIGGPIRIVDARGKDAEPITVQAQDNMLHIDNTPFNDEYKVILTWEKDKPSGPKGQNFVFIPGTHQGARNCFNTDGHAWSTENASIFITEEDVEQIFDFQKKTLGCDGPMVVEVKHDEKPLTTIFAAGSLVHHRYRTEEGFSRSCMILAFHRAADNKGQFISPEYLKEISEPGDLNQYLFGHHGAGTNGQFLGALQHEASAMGQMLESLIHQTDGAEHIPQEMRSLSSEEVAKWKDVATHAPKVEDIKIESHFIPLSEELFPEAFFGLVKDMMVFDKHGPLDLILYGDSREEIRKWARNQIREMRIDHLQARLGDWLPFLEQPRPEHILEVDALKELSDAMAEVAKNGIDTGAPAKLASHEKISSHDAYRAMHRLIIDLGEAIVRCDDRQTFLSTSLFLFWACDTLQRLLSEQSPELQKAGQALLSHYVATSVLIEKQIHAERVD